MSDGGAGPGAPPAAVAVVQPQEFTAVIASNSHKKHTILVHLELYSNYELKRVYTPSDLPKLKPRDGNWARIRPKNAALHGGAFGLSWTAGTSTTVIARQLVGNPYSHNPAHHLPRMKVRAIDAASPAGVALSAIKAAVHPYMKKQASSSSIVGHKRAASVAATSALLRHESGEPEAQRPRTGAGADAGTVAPVARVTGVFGGAGNFIIHASNAIVIMMGIIVVMSQALRRFFFARGIPFSAVEDPWLLEYTKQAIAFGRAGGRMPTREELADPSFVPTPGLVFALPKAQVLGGTELDAEMAIAQKVATAQRIGQVGVNKTGVSCTSDGADLNNNPLYNICFVSRHGPIFAGVYDLDVAGAYVYLPALSLSLSLSLTRGPQSLLPSSRY